MKKRLLLKLGLFALLAASLFVAWLWWTTPTSGVNWATANRIQNGMTFDEVKAIIGEFPTSYTISCGPQGTQAGYKWHSTGNDSQSISVLMDVNGKVMVKTYDSEFMTVLDKLRHWLHFN